MTSEITETEAHRIAVKIATSGKSGRVHQMAYEAAKAGALAALAARPAPEAGSVAVEDDGTAFDPYDLIQSQTAQIASLSAKVAEVERERDEARTLVTEANNSLYGSQGYFHSLNGGSFDKYHLARGIENLKEHSRKAYNRATAAEARASELQREVERKDKALRWYEDQARAAAKYMKKFDAGPVEAILTAMALDAGGRARAALQQEGKSDV